MSEQHETPKVSARIRRTYAAMLVLSLGMIAGGCYLLHPAAALLVPGLLVWHDLRSQ